MNWKRVEVFLEFLIFGVLIGVIEDLIAVRVVANEPITLEVVKVVVLIAVPFAFLGEIVIDRIDFVEIVKRIFRKNARISRVKN